MTSVLQTIANGIYALRFPVRTWQYQPSSRDGFAEDRYRLYNDHIRVMGDMKKGIDKVKKQHGSEAHRR